MWSGEPPSPVVGVTELSRDRASQSVRDQALADLKPLWLTFAGRGEQGLRAQVHDPESQEADPDRGGERSNDRGPVSE